ncbi:MAG TPA: S41 family peptidase [Gemmatimonadaceae bacterium]|nr:S41 family peptidase [Gemmatimonadaceae bacterium]
MSLDINPGIRSRTITVAALLTSSLFTGGWLIVRGAHDNPATPAEAERLFNQVFTHVERFYVDSVPPNMLYRKAVDGMLYELEDPYTSLLPPEKFTRLHEVTSGNYAGVGLQVDVRDGWIVVIAPAPGSPAERAGIQPGDRVVEIDGHSAKGWTLEEATAAFRGAPGTKLALRVERPGMLAPVPYTLERAPLHQSAVRRVAMLPNAVGYIDLKAFSDSTTQELTSSINALMSKGMKSLILDMRSNPGGLLDQGLSVADLFLGRGQRIASLKGRAEPNREYNDTTAQRWPGLPLVILVDDRSASATEIVAGALQDHDRALIVGEPTYGKGSAQSIIPLGAAGGLKITTSRWYTPAGRSISRRAVREDSDEPEDEKEQKYKTDAGRTVFGGGGIAPDVIAADSTARRQSRVLQMALGRKVGQFRDAITDYSLALKAKGEVKSPQFVVTPAMLDEVWKRMVARGVEIPRMTYDESSPLVSSLLAFDIARYVFGPEAEFRRRVATDRVIGEGLEMITGVKSQAALLDRAAAKQKAQEQPANE